MYYIILLMSQTDNVNFIGTDVSFNENLINLLG